MKFEWDDEKNQSNIAQHGVDFEDATKVFYQPGLDRGDDREDYGEERRIRLGFVQGVPLFVVYTVRLGNWRIISARIATIAEEEILVEEIEGERKIRQDKRNRKAKIDRARLESQLRIVEKKEREDP
ncbi:MAG: BrnT family toxin [Candidatus Obscuribacterales bacterium]|nr:BrnT family toxin [Candidatus Obscuribacterales bacterium]